MAVIPNVVAGTKPSASLWGQPVTDHINTLDTQMTNLTATVAAISVVQGLMKFNNVAARDTGLPAPVEGMLVYTVTEATFWFRTASAWINLATHPTFAAQYVTGTKGAGAPGGTGNDGDRYYDTTNDRQYLSDGVGWIIMSEPPQSYTPTFGGTTLGNGSRVGTYQRSGGRMDFIATFTLGSTSAITGNVSVLMPKTASNLLRGEVQVALGTAGGIFGLGINNIDSMLQPSVLAHVASGTYLTPATLSASVPWVWAAGDSIAVVGKRILMTTIYT